MKAAGRSSNLRAILADDESVRQTVAEMVTTMGSIDKEDVRGYRLASMLDPSLPDHSLDPRMKPFDLKPHEYRLLCNVISHSTPQERLKLPRHAFNLEEVSTRGVCYGTSKSPKYRNSAIMYRLSDTRATEMEGQEGEQKAGIIHSIFHYTHYLKSTGNTWDEVKGYYLIVGEYPPMETTDERVDPYKKFGFAGGFLCQGQVTKQHLLKLSQVISHCAVTKFRGNEFRDMIHVLPIDRVCEFQLLRSIPLQ